MDSKFSYPDRPRNPGIKSHVFLVVFWNIEHSNSSNLTLEFDSVTSEASSSADSIMSWRTGIPSPHFHLLDGKSKSQMKTRLRFIEIDLAIFTVSSFSLRLVFWWHFKVHGLLLQSVTWTAIMILIILTCEPHTPWLASEIVVVWSSESPLKLQFSHDWTNDDSDLWSTWSKTTKCCYNITKDHDRAQKPSLSPFFLTASR